MKTPWITTLFPLTSIITMLMTTGVALADNVTAAPVDDSQCPCNFSEASLKSEFTRISKGTIQCVQSNAILFQPSKPGPSKPISGVVLTSLGNTADSTNLTMNVWGITMLFQPENDPNGSLVNVCGKNLQGNKVKEVIKNDKQLQACFTDVVHAAALLGVACEDKS